MISTIKILFIIYKVDIGETTGRQNKINGGVK